MDTDDEDSANGVVKDPDIPKVWRGLQQIKENIELENCHSQAEKDWNKMINEDYEFQKNLQALNLLM